MNLQIGPLYFCLVWSVDRIKDLLKTTSACDGSIPRDITDTLITSCVSGMLIRLPATVCIDKGHLAWQDIEGVTRHVWTKKQKGPPGRLAHLGCICPAPIHSPTGIKLEPALTRRYNASRRPQRGYGLLRTSIIFPACDGGVESFSVQFSDQSGHAHTGIISQCEYSGFNAITGESVTIVYDPSDPSSFAPGNALKASAPFWPIFTALIGLVTLVLLLF